MGAIKDIRTALVADLSELGMPVHTEVPRRFSPPAILVIPDRSGSYIEPGQTNGFKRIHLEVWVVTRPHLNDELADLEELETLAESILNLGWAVQGVDAPVLANIDNTDYPTMVIHLSEQFKL